MLKKYVPVLAKSLLLGVVVVLTACSASLDQTDANTFTYDGHTYHIVNEAKNWADASQAARDMNGHLLYINSAEEQAAIEKNIKPFIDKGELSSSPISEGENGQYLWIGLYDLGDWFHWSISGSLKDPDLIAIGSSFDGSLGWSSYNFSSEPEYQNWGTQTGLTNTAGALSLNGWSGTDTAGTMGKWNDLKKTNTLPYIIEIED